MTLPNALADALNALNVQQAALDRAQAELAREQRHQAPPLAAGTTVRAVIGVDGGSTSSKAVLVDEAGAVIAKAYQLSKGNPIDDTFTATESVSR